MSLPVRTINRFLSKNFPAPLLRQTIISSDLVNRELISSFQMYSEVQDVGKDLLKRHAHQDLPNSFSRFQSFIRQAITFYQAAEALHYRASPLLFYYSFMNFAKAITFVRDPTFPFGHIHHGLIPGAGVGAMRNHFVTVPSRGIFPRFYQQVTGIPIGSKTKLRIVGLLGYVSDVSFEYRYFKMGNLKFCFSKYAIVNYLGLGEWKALLSINHGGYPAIAKDVARMLKSDFSEVMINPVSARNVLEIAAEETHLYSFWETKKTYPPNNLGQIDPQPIVIETTKALTPNWGYWPFDDQFLITINLNPSTPRPVVMTEILAIYTIMFYFGSLVRYRPEVLEGMLLRKDAWMIESFLRNTPTTFLRHAKNLLDGNYWAFRQR